MDGLTEYDLSMPIRAGMPTFPGDPVPTVSVERSIERGDPYRLSTLSMGTHTGTHLDAPSHFLPEGKTLDQMDLGVLNGPCEVVRVPEGRSSIFPRDLEGVPTGTDRVLFRTTNSDRWSTGEGYFPDFVDLSPGAAREIVQRGIRLVGIDSLSIESDPSQEYPVHRTLLDHDVVILEGLVLADVPPGPGTLRCLPIRLAGSDGAPCRAVLARE